MSVFKPRERMAEHYVDGTEIECVGGHKWNGQPSPEVNPDIHEVQYPELQNAPCDCGRLLRVEKICSCGTPKWEVKLVINKES